MARSQVTGLPAAFVEVAEFDPLRYEGRAYAARRESAGIPVEIHEVKGGVHGYEFVECELTDIHFKIRINALIMTSLFTPVTLGRIQLANRVVMAPMTRSRADPLSDEPTPIMAEYYAQRASAGLIVSEGIHPGPEGKGYCRTPGLYTRTQVSGWKKVTEAVHERGGKIVAQLMHVGRVAHSDNKADGSITIAPSAIAARERIYTDTAGMQPMDRPREMTLDQIYKVIAEYRKATELAYDAGFDGVELHCTSGYLPAQFLSTGTNRRTDAYGGSLENRIRFPREVIQAMSSVDGSDRVGFRICPGNPFNDLQDDDPERTLTAFLISVADMALAYLHVIRMNGGGIDNVALAREHFRGALILNDGYDYEEATAAVARGEGDAVSFGRLFISNPDLVERFREGRSLNRMDPKTLYSHGSVGYTDYH